MTTISHRLYGGVTAALALTVGPLFALHPRGRARLGERFGNWDLPAREFVWFHGASLGEMNGLMPLMRRWRSHFPAVPILVTATSTTGLARAAEVADEVRLVPFDHPVFIERAIGGATFRAFIFGETEIWPGLLGVLERRGVPRWMVNARIGERSLRRYRGWAGLFGPVFGSLTAVHASSMGDRERLIACGVPEIRCHASGNSKYDLATREVSVVEIEAMRRRLSPHGAPLLVLGSLRPGEERFWFPVLREFQHAPLAVVVAPRHPEKFEMFATELRRSGLAFRRWSAPESLPPAEGLDVVLLDTLGDLPVVYRVADFAFVGGSLVDWGGHNPLEPALLGVPIGTGPFMSSVEEIVIALDNGDARIKVETQAEVRALVERVVQRDAGLREMGARGGEVAVRFLGAAERVFASIAAYLEETRGSDGA